jgi:hypothetical protein
LASGSGSGVPYAFWHIHLAISSGVNGCQFVLNELMILGVRNAIHKCHKMNEGTSVIVVLAHHDALILPYEFLGKPVFRSSEPVRRASLFRSSEPRIGVERASLRFRSSEPRVGVILDFLLSAAALVRSSKPEDFLECCLSWRHCSNFLERCFN